jgi:hypothetical protein
MIKIEDGKILPEITERINSILNQEELLDERKVRIIVTNSKKSIKTV